MVLNIQVPQDKITDFCQHHRIRRLSLFGSVMRDNFGPDSDVDVLVEFEADATISLFDLGGMQVELSELLGVSVDLKTPGFLSRHFRRDVMEKAHTLFERA